MVEYKVAVMGYKRVFRIRYNGKPVEGGVYVEVLSVEGVEKSRGGRPVSGMTPLLWDTVQSLCEQDYLDRVARGEA